MIKIESRKQGLLSAGVSALVAMVGAVAGDVAWVGVAQAQEAVALESITVTARKRSESLQDAPVSVSAFSAEDLKTRGASGLADLSRLSPNVEINTGRADGGSSNAAVFIRGVGQYDHVFPTDPGVGIYLDGVYIARSVGAMLDLADIERVEVLRGPQGTLYGKGTIGGAVNLVTAPPAATLGGRVELTTGRFDRFDARGVLNVPLLADRLLGKISFSTSNRDGYDKRLLDGQRNGDIDRSGGRASLLWKANDAVDVLFAGDYSRIHQHDTAKVLLGTFPASAMALYNAVAVPFLNASLGLPADSQYDNRWLTGSRYSTNGTGPNFDRNETYGLSAVVDWRIDERMALKSVTAFRHMKARVGTDLDDSPYPIIGTDEDQHQRQFSQEFNLSGRSFGDALDWLVGAYYFRENGRDHNLVQLVSGLYQGLELLPGPVVPLGPFTCPGGPACAGGAGNPINAAFDFDLVPTSSIRTTNIALFTQDTYHLTSRLAFSLGARWTREQKNYFLESGYPASNQVVVAPTNDENSWSVFTPKAGVEFKYSPDLLLYASASKGFKSGGWNPRPLAAGEFRRYDPEYVLAYELGAKADLAQHRLTWNTAVFFSDYKDIQLSTNTVGANNNLLLTVSNAGRAHIYGVESEIAARPVAPLTLQLGVGFLQNEYTELNPGVGWSIDNKLPDAPRWTGSAAAQYLLSLGDAGSLQFAADLTYRSKTFKDPENHPEIVQAGYGLLGANIKYLSPNSRWSASLFGTNLTNKYYLTSGNYVSAFGLIEGTVGRPREWGLTVQLQF